MTTERQSMSGEWQPIGKLTKAKKQELIGKKIRWFRSRCPHRGYSGLMSGVVDQFSGRNIMIDGDWKWFPDLRLPEVEAPPATQHATERGRG